MYSLKERHSLNLVQLSPSLFCRFAFTIVFSEILSVLVVCEWSYGSWGERVASTTVREDFVTYEWVDLHSGPYFTKVVNYLRDLLDQEGERMTSDNDELGRQLCQQRFLQAVQLEEDFFENAYRTTS